MMTTFETVSTMIAKQLRLNAEDITPEKRLVEDLHADSADNMVLLMDMKDTFIISVEDDAVNTLGTVRDVVNYIETNK